MKKSLLFAVIMFVCIASCQNDDSLVNNNQVAFTSFSVPVSTSPITLNIAFANPAAASGFLTLTATNTNVEYITDYTTSPEAIEDKIIVPFEAGASTVSFVFQPASVAIEGQQKSVKLKITNISITAVAIPENSSTIELTFGEAPVSESTLSAILGGPNLPNQVYIDLSSGMQTGILRTHWDLAFYSGDDFRVKLNGSISMAVKQLATTDLAPDVAIDPSVAVGTQNGIGIDNGDIGFIDDPDGTSNGIVISVSETETNNKVYLLNLGNGLSGANTNDGEVNFSGTSRGWLKIRVLRDTNGYKFQYAELDSPTYTEVLIAKQPAQNFTFFSFTTHGIVNVEPAKEKWDLNLTTFTDYVDFGSGNVSFTVPDFAAINNLGGTRAYEVLETASLTYETFSAVNLQSSLFALPQSADQRVIGSNWRVSEPFGAAAVKADRFYIIRDEAGNIYKLRFISLASDSGQRGTITFEYELVF